MPGRLSSPAWSSDGGRVAYAGNRDAGPGNYEVHVMNADGTGQTRLTNNTAHELYPAWRPQSAPQAPAAPALLTEPGAIWAVALDSVTQFTVRLPDDPAGPEYVWVSLNVRGTLSNKAVITLRSK